MATRTDHTSSDEPAPCGGPGDRPPRADRRRWLAAAAASAVAFLGAPRRAAAQAAPVRWQLATGYPADGFHARNIQQFAQDVARLTDGALQIEVQAGGQLARLPDILPGLQAGRFEAGEVLLSAHAAQWPLAAVDAIPFVVSGYPDARRLAELARPHLAEAARAQGLQWLFDVPWPPQGLYANRPVRAIADLRGLRMRTYNDTTRRFAEYVNAQAVEIGAVDLPEALRTGRIDAMITSAATGIESQAWRGMTHFYDVNAWIPKNAVAVRSAALQALAPPVRDALMRAAETAQARGWQMSEDTAAAGRRKLAEQGMVVEPPGAILARELKRLGEKFSLEWIRATQGVGNAIFLPYFEQAAGKG